VRRRALLAVLVLACGACARVHHVPAGEGEPGAQGEGKGGGIPPAPGRPRVPTSPEALLAEGAVRDVQRALAARHLLGEHEPGKLDEPTSAALRRFQRERELAATGFPDRETLELLGIDPERAYVKKQDRARARRPPP
jgi:Putative peptidoglycan binding domain